MHAQELEQATSPLEQAVRAETRAYAWDRAHTASWVWDVEFVCFVSLFNTLCAPSQA